MAIKDIQITTGNGNGPFGLGWNLSVPEIRRKTSKGIPIYDDLKDTFILSGFEDLVAISNDESTGTTIYRPRTEGLFACISHHKNNNNDYWKVQNKDGTVNIYGTPKPSDTAIDWQDSAVVSDPDYQDHIFLWKLTMTY